MKVKYSLGKHWDYFKTEFDWRKAQAIYKIVYPDSDNSLKELKRQAKDALSTPHLTGEEADYSFFRAYLDNGHLILCVNILPCMEH